MFEKLSTHDNAALWPGSESPKTPEVKTEEKIQDTEGMASKENPVWPGYEDGHTPDEAGSDPPSELEEDNQDPDEPEDKSFQTWIVFEGDLFAVRVDQLSAEQEHDMENGRPYRFMDIEDSSYMKQQIAERVKEAKEKKGMAENDNKEKEKAAAAKPLEDDSKEKETATAAAKPLEEKDDDPSEEPPPTKSRHSESRATMTQGHQAIFSMTKDASSGL